MRRRTMAATAAGVLALAAGTTRQPRPGGGPLGLEGLQALARGEAAEARRGRSARAGRATASSEGGRTACEC